VSDTTPVYLRVIAAVVVVALIGGWVVLLVFPTDHNLFVWPIQPRLSAFMLGSAYLAGSYYWVQVLLGRPWQAIQAGLLPVALFAATLGIATAIHWDKFDHGTRLILIWVGLYAAVPFVLPIAWLVERRRRPSRPSASPAVARGVRLILATTGALQLILGLAMFLDPGAFAHHWPWQLTDLTARTTSAWFAWGLVWILLVREERATAFRVPIDATIVGVAVALLGLARGHAELNWSRAATWLMAVGLLVALLALIAESRSLHRAASAQDALTISAQ
jgi:hypothetical protein